MQLFFSMKSIQKLIFFLSSLSLFFILFNHQLFAQGKKLNEKRIEALVVSVLEESKVIEANGNEHPYQRLKILGTSGNYKGKDIIIENGKFDQSTVPKYAVGDRIVVTVGVDQQGKKFFTITDYVRREPLYIITALFVLLTIFIGRKRGIASLIGLVLSFFIIFNVVLPQISSGKDPVLITIGASLIIIPITFYLSHGLNKKTTLAVIGTVISLAITGVLATIFVDATHLTGFASEEAGFLNNIKQGGIDIHALLLAGIIIGLLGVLDDVTISQAAIVFQLKDASPHIPFKELYRRAMDIGRDHIASMANTLILVYAGASLPLLLLFINNPLPFNEVINYEIIAEEIVRTMVASIGLIIAVPITTLLTSLYIEMDKSKKQEKILPPPPHKKQ